MTSRGIAFHTKPMASDIKEALIVLVVNPRQAQVVSFSRMFDALIAQQEPLTYSARRNMQKNYSKTPHSRLLAGARMFESESGRATVPVTQYVVKKGISVLDDPMTEINDCLPTSHSKAAGILVVPQDEYKPIQIEWLRRQKNNAIGKLKSAAARMEHASSHPDVKLLRQKAEKLDDAFQLALPSK